MIGTRIMPGLENLTGRTIGTLRVGEMVERHPQPKYKTTCLRCQSESTAISSRLTSGAATCRNSACGKPQRLSGRELLAEQRRQTAEREAQRRTEDLEASELRMAAECDEDGWERPVTHASKPSRYQPMTERERLALRERREAEELERIEADRPRLEAERKAAEERNTAEQRERERNEKHRAYWVEWVLNHRDPKLFVSDAVRSASLSKAQADAFNDAESKRFISDTPEYVEYRTPENANKILGYLNLNGVRIADAATFRAAFVRLRDLGILQKKSESKAIDQPRTVNLNIAPSKKPKAQTYQGFDLDTGEPRAYSAWEVNHMSSETFRAAFRLQRGKGDLSLLPLHP